MSEQQASEDAAKPEEGFEWAIVEVFGHRRHAGRCREEEKFGTKMLRIDVPTDGDPEKGWTTQFYGGASIFSFTLTDEATVMKINKPYALPSRLTYREESEMADSDDDRPF